MPIRTNRGRAAVYRRLWGWPLRSPKHLVFAIVLLVVLITAIGIILPKVLVDRNGRNLPPGSASSAETTSTRSPQAPGAAPQSTRLTSPLKSPTSAPPNPEALTVAKSWAAAWVNHPAGITNEQWLQALRPLTTDEYLPQMSTVDPANIPATKVTGDPTPTTSYTSSVEVQVPTDGPKLTITVVNTGAGWRVSRYDQAG
ncbi:hypothetical protein [Amycolatopsis anabasis]|uniref:hypothetical protein n=1 Tax=Amycolatopsis anabasis TaxID=1840409 RepID=UPI00131B25D4|nr:hypothetical protein [Amycolatopsis anabasis]